MRVKTEKEKEAIGKLTPIFRELNIRKDISGYEPILDFICHEYAFPNDEFKETLNILEKENFYIGIKQPKTKSSIMKHVKEVANKEMLIALEEGSSLQKAQLKADSRAKETEMKLLEENKFALLPAMKRCIVTALEHTKRCDETILSKYSLDSLTIILEDENMIKEEWIKDHLLEYIGEEYAQYETYEERVVAFFSKNLLQYIK